MSKMSQHRARLCAAGGPRDLSQRLTSETDVSNVPSWTHAADRALRAAVAHVRLVRAATPTNTVAEVRAAEGAFEQGTLRVPCFRYPPPALDPTLETALLKLSSHVEGEAPLGPLYAARARELALECSLIRAMGTPELTALSAQRFVGDTAAERADGACADRLAQTWLEEAAALGNIVTGELVECADPVDPRSLLSQMTAEVGRLRLPVRVIVDPQLSSLAATGEGTVFVAKGRRITPRDGARTVYHEVYGHVLPRLAALREPLGLFAFGSARGMDDQEGRALLLERRAGFLDTVRKGELALRHLAARATLQGADYVEVVRLLRNHGGSARVCVRVATRVMRGAAHDGSTMRGGLAREVIYLPAFVAVSRALGDGAWGASSDASAERAALVAEIMARGRIASAVAPLLATWRSAAPF